MASNIPVRFLYFHLLFYVLISDKYLMGRHAVQQEQHEQPSKTKTRMQIRVLAQSLAQNPLLHPITLLSLAFLPVSRPPLCLLAQRPSPKMPF